MLALPETKPDDSSEGVCKMLNYVTFIFIFLKN
jgi:hypothetical protein